MFESFGRGLRMIWASIRMGWKDKRLLLPSVIPVFTNFLFGTLLMYQGMLFFHHDNAQPAPVATHQMSPHNLIHQMAQGGGLNQMTALNGAFDQGGWASQVAGGNSENAYAAALIGAIWWLTTAFLEGVTIALVYSHLTEGAGSGKVSVAAEAVFASMPAIIQLGLVTVIARKLAQFFKNKKGGTGFGFGFLAGIVQVYWTIACHLIMPAIVIEGTSFWGAMKRADKIASGNLLTIGFGEVGVDGICNVVMMGIGGIGASGLGYGVYSGLIHSSAFMLAAFLWACLVVVTTASFLYLRAAFYTCIYVWAIEAESAMVHDREDVRPPAPLAHALA